MVPIRQARLQCAGRSFAAGAGAADKMPAEANKIRMALLKVFKDISVFKWVTSPFFYGCVACQFTRSSGRKYPSSGGKMQERGRAEGADFVEGTLVVGQFEF